MKRKQAGQVLIVLVGSLLMGGSGLAAGLFLTGKTSKQIRKDALTIVADEHRRSEIRTVLKSWEREVKQLDKMRQQRIDGLVALLDKHDAMREEFEPVFTGFDEAERQAFATALAMRFALREQLSAEQWRELFPGGTSPSESERGIAHIGMYAERDGVAADLRRARNIEAARRFEPKSKLVDLYVHYFVPRISEHSCWTIDETADAGGWLDSPLLDDYRMLIHGDLQDTTEAAWHLSPPFAP